VAGSFDALLNGPESVEELRAAILELAVRGRLVPSELGATPVPVGAEGSEGPVELPHGWRWATPDDLKSNEKNALAIGPFGSNLLRTDYTDSGVPLVFVRDITSRQFGGPRAKYVSTAKAKELSSHFVYPGDLLITKMGSPPGDTAIYPLQNEPAIITADCIRFAPDPTLTSSDFLQVAIESTLVRSQIVDITMGVAHQKVSLGRFRTVLLPLPPVAEQKRIVAKVDELMKLCDALEDALHRAEDTAKNLADALVAELLA
jgi:type I restriction enzyme S subunit